MSSASLASPETALPAARQVLVALLTAWKSYSLFPEDNDICRAALTTLLSSLDTFLGNYGSLRLNVEDNRLLFEEHTIHQGTSETEDLAFLLFREGIRWLEFQRGIEHQEIVRCFRVLQAYRSSDDELVGDLSGALTNEELVHIEFDFVSPLGDGQNDLDFSQFSLGPSGGASHGQAEIAAIEFQQAEPVSLPDPAKWKLTSEEAQKLRIMVLEEETRDVPDDFVDALLMVLDEQTEEDGFITVVRYLQEEFGTALAEARFQLAYRLLSNVLALREACRAAKPWVSPVIDQFLDDISEPEGLSILATNWPDPDGPRSEDARLLRRTILLLPPKTMLSLGPLLTRLPSLRTQLQIADIIAELARRDFEPLKRLLDRADDELAERLVLILGDMRGNGSVETLRKMLCHPSARVKSATIRALMLRDTHVLEDIFPLLEDSDESVSHLVLKQLGTRKSRQVEDLLLTYLQNKRCRRADRSHLLACYGALGACGSDRSVPFLRSMLLHESIIPDVSRSLHRQGAAVALHILGTADAEKILQDASQSRLSSVRLACRKAREFETEQTRA